ncbi:hypothetical protein DA076_10470 [Lactiplantibacillus plantarum]|nr:hypothetical protein DA076_10470 [Lactiplantibacillus plantarum]
MDELIGTLSDFKPAGANLIDKLNNEFSDRGVNVKWFGAKGDGKSNDTEAIQAAIDYLFNHNLFGSVVFPAGVYNVSRPILLKSTNSINNDAKSWWKGSGITLAGYGKASTIINKTTGECLTGIGDGVDNIDATVIAVRFSNEDAPSYVPLGTSTGSGIKNITLQNSQEHICFGLYGSAFQRGNISGVNIESYSGISLQDPFSSIFTDVAINAVKDGFVIDKGTSNTFTNVHVHDCINPLQIMSAYSTMQNCFTENCTGTLWKIGGPSLVLSGCGDESPHAQWTVEPHQGFITLNGYYHVAPQGDSSTNLLTNQCGFVHTNNNDAAVSIKDLYVRFFDTAEINGNGQSYLFYHDSIDSFTNYSIENIFYATDKGNVQLLGGISPNQVAQKDMPFVFSNGLSHGTDLGHLQSRGTDINFYRGHYMPYLGSRDVNGFAQADFKDKAIYLDMENTHQTSTLDASGKPSDIQNLPAFNQGDLLMFNDPVKQAAMGAIVNNQPAKVQNQAYNKFSMVPLIMYGTTDQRPGTNVDNTPAEGLTPGTMYYDWTISKPIWWHGTWWADAMGNKV